MLSTKMVLPTYCAPTKSEFNAIVKGIDSHGANILADFTESETVTIVVTCGQELRGSIFLDICQQVNEGILNLLQG